MHRLTYRRAALVLGTLLSALTMSGLPARGAPPIVARPPTRPVTPVRFSPTVSPTTIQNDVILSAVRNQIIAVQGFTPIALHSTQYSPYVAYLQSQGLRDAAYRGTLDNLYYSMIAPSWSYSYPMMQGYGSGYGGYGSGYGGGGSNSSGDASSTDYAQYYRTREMASAGLERRNLPTGPLSNLMKADGGLDWPLALRILPPAPEAAELRRQLESRAAEIQNQGSRGKLDEGLVRETNRDLDQLTRLLVDKADRLPVSEQATTEARLFLRKFRDALKSAE